MDRTLLERLKHMKLGNQVKTIIKETVNCQSCGVEMVKKGVRKYCRDCAYDKMEARNKK